MLLSSSAILPLNPESAPRRIDNVEDSLKGSDGAETGTPDNVRSMPGGATYNLDVFGGTGGSGGQGGEHGGPGGAGEAPNITFPNSKIYLTNPEDPKLQSIKEKLASHVAAQHKFTDQSKSLCAPGTRVEIQAHIEQWLLVGSLHKEHIFWITGIAGSGKSTLSATVVDKLRKKGTPVAAQFFVSRNIPETTNPDKVIPTVAKQLAESSPTAAHIIDDRLKYGFPSSRQEQVEALLLAPIRELSKSHNAVIILIDALDELENAAENVMEILLSIAPKGCDLPDNVRFLITSRPEHWADISTSKTLELAVFKQHPLTTDSSMAEVHSFIIARMGEIRPKDWDDGPTRDQLLGLSTKADGLFHYAATALQWIKEQIRKRGKACRKEVFEKFAQLGIGQLEDLYRLILTSFENIDNPTQDAGARTNQLHGFRQVIGTILVLDEPLAIGQITALLADISVDDFDVAHFLKQFRNVLISGTTTSFQEATPQMHKSFRDYIMGVRAPAEFRILTGHAHFVTARSCLEVIIKPRSRPNVVVEYSIGHWHTHLREAVDAGTIWDDERMWNLCGLIVEKAIVKIWEEMAWPGFLNVCAAGWGLLKQGVVRGRPTFNGMSILIGGDSTGLQEKVRDFPLLHVLVLLTFPCLLVSSRECYVRAFPLSPVLVLLTFPCLLVSSGECVLFLCLPSMSRSLSFTFLSLDFSVYFSSATHPCLAHFPLPSRF
ncbi:hypothetical protein K438DRAFT_2012356 [Mycena galopus ATCC 62051]|nr:hypothetical protein K438DRAFT_2012356 [Mycena galopus ATCC 62051]